MHPKRSREGGSHKLEKKNYEDCGTGLGNITWGASPKETRLYEGGEKETPLSHLELLGRGLRQGNQLKPG